MSERKKLNIFQRGILQKAVTVFAYLGSIAIGAFILDWADKRLFTSSIKAAEHRGLVPSDVSSRLQMFIDGRDSTTIFSIILVGLFCVVLGWFFMRWAAKRNWSWPVTLPKVVEFRSAMRKLGITAPEDEIAFVKKYKVPIFIACKPLPKDEQEVVRAQLYAFAHHSSFSESEVFERHIGKQTLCLDAEDYELLLLEGKRHSALEESVILAGKNTEIRNLRTLNAALVQENADLIEERDKLRGKVRIQPAQEDGRVDRLRIERLLWTAYIPIIDRLIQEAPKGKQYTTDEIKDAFKTEWDKRADLRKQMQFLTGNEDVCPSKDFLKAIKAEFKEAGKLHPGGRPKKNP